MYRNKYLYRALLCSLLINFTRIYSPVPVSEFMYNDRAALSVRAFPIVIAWWLKTRRAENQPWIHNETARGGNVARQPPLQDLAVRPTPTWRPGSISQVLGDQFKDWGYLYPPWNRNVVDCMVCRFYSGCCYYEK